PMAGQSAILCDLRERGSRELCLDRLLALPRGMLMKYQYAIGAFALAAVLLIESAGAQAFDDAQYPNLKGQWNRIGSPRWDQQDRDGERAPLTPEYRAIH